ncbi:class I adenylate-forming enzyme family protein [Lentzea sp. CC55]|uniref:class I adenylate-forming enzyme family protein n=1 Tax=Lentzea sp. CC55 TaxID=2884909 RepID=UPI001F34DB23|nr:class I adenylate-forming enzyme family protein [Lentzea sp. CC55]MCG8922443.1 acyl--CoA ligase [Lentzea sp. CC55]
MPAMLFAPDVTFTFDELEQRALCTADVLREKGLGLGDRVLVKVDNSVSYLSTLLALMHVGASVVLVDHQQKPGQTAEACTRSLVKMVIVDDEAPISHDQEVVHCYELAVGACGRKPVDAALDFSAWCELPDSIIMWSSGSTGEPKGVVKNGGRFLKNLQRNADLVGHRPDDVLLPLLPFNHQYGISMVLIAWLVRCSLVIAPYRRLDRALRLAGMVGATVVDATPATYKSILNIVERQRSFLGTFGEVRMLCSGAAPLDPALSHRAAEVYGLPLLDSYGSTEMGNVAFATPDNPVGTGRPVEGMEVRIRGEDGSVLPAGQIGEIEVLDPDLMEGYLDPQGTVTPVAREWYATNDFGYLDADGNLFVAGRKTAVHRNGYTLHPEIIEHTLAARGCIAMIVALPDERRGSTLVFYVEDEQKRDPAHWRELINNILPKYEQPNRVNVVGRFPLNRNGKPDRKQLEERALAEDS